MADEKVEEKKFKKVIQPVDNTGVAIGSPHVYEADSQEDLDKLVEDGIKNGTKKIREQEEELRKLRAQLATQPAKAPEGSEPEIIVPEYKPRALTEEEKFIIKTDPEKAFDIQYEAKFGIKPDEAGRTQKRMREISEYLRAEQETEKWVRAHQEDYFGCKENEGIIMKYLQSHNMLLSYKNLDLAFKELSAGGLLVQAPPEVQTATVEPAARTEQPVKRSRDTSVLPSTIQRQESGPSAPVNRSKKEPTPAEIGTMTSEQLKKLWPELESAR